MASTLWPTRTRISFLDVTVVTVIQIEALDVKACLQTGFKSPAREILSLNLLFLLCLHTCRIGSLLGPRWELRAGASMAPPRLATHLFGPFHMVHLVSPFRMGPAEPAAPVVVTTAVPRRSYEVSLEGQESSVGALVGLFQAQQQLADPLAMPWLRHPAKRARRDREHALGESHFPSLGEGAALRQHSLLVSKTVSGFARYPDRRPAGQNSETTETTSGLSRARTRWKQV